jgi:hypothetical protein
MVGADLLHSLAAKNGTHEAMLGGATAERQKKIATPRWKIVNNNDYEFHGKLNDSWNVVKLTTNQVTPWRAIALSLQ